MTLWTLGWSLGKRRKGPVVMCLKACWVVTYRRFRRHVKGVGNLASSYHFSDIPIQFKIFGVCLADIDRG